MMSTVLKCKRAIARSNLATKVMRGGAWLGAASISEQLFRFARNMVLTRLLAPEAFGLMAIVLSISAAVDAFSEIGVREALIQNPKGNEERYVVSAWWLSVSRAFSLYLVTFVSAPWVARFYGKPELTLLIRIALLGVLFGGAASSRAYVALKEMQFRKWAIIQHGGGVSGIVVTITLAFLIRGVWALVVGFVMENLIRTAISYFVCPFKPKFRIDWNSTTDLLRFSRRMFGLSFLNLVFTRADVFVLGKLYSAAALGVYIIAVSLVQVPTGFVMNMLGQVMMPTFSQIQNDYGRMNRLLARVNAAVLLLLIPGVVFVLVSGRNLLALFYGRRYIGGYWPLVLAGFVALINLVNGQITTALYASGRPELHRYCVGIMAVTIMIVIYPLVMRFGMLGGQIACLLSVFTGYVIQIVQIQRLTGFRWTSHSRSVIVAVVASVVVSVGLLAERHTILMTAPHSNMVLGFIASGIVLSLSAFVFAREIGQHNENFAMQ